MKILFLTKRYYMARDLVRDRYGRFYEIPKYLAAAGHEVNLVCLAYRQASGQESELVKSDHLKTYTCNLGWNPVAGFMQHYRRLSDLIKQTGPDLIVAASDCYQVILGAKLSRQFALPFIADLYDNFEAYGASRVPGILPQFYKSLAGANAITVVSSTLQRYLQSRLRNEVPIHVMENAVTDIFLAARDKQAARRVFNFLPDATYIGTAGDLGDQRGINRLVEAFLELVADNNKLHLVLAGRTPESLKRIRHPNLHLPGQLDHQDIPELLSALDVGVISLRDDLFGRYCFPQKYYEMVSCQLPLVAAAVGNMPALLEHSPELLFRPGDRQDLRRALDFQIRNRKKIKTHVPSWQEQALRIEKIAAGVVSGG